MSQPSPAQAGSPPPPYGIAYQLVDLHEQHTKDGYREDTYPGAQIDALARGLYSALGRPLPAGVHIPRAQALHLARVEWHRQTDTPDADATWRIEVVETNPRLSYCGEYVFHPEITGPSSDEEQGIITRALELEAQGHAVRIVAEGTQRRTVWVGKLPWPD